MVLQSNREELSAAWRALAGNQTGAGWITIPITHNSLCNILAGRHFPGNEVALLVGFSQIKVPEAEYLPKGHGFAVIKTDLAMDENESNWIAVYKQDAGDLELFTTMIDDVITVLDDFENEQGQRVLNAFLLRIRAWQDFMRYEGHHVLGFEPEIGLFGELEVLCDIIKTGVKISDAVAAWLGPLRGIHDFSFGIGAIEVKTTASSHSFPALIGSLEQLDDSLISPLYLTGVRLSQADEGRTLSEQITLLRDFIHEDRNAFSEFNSKLLHAGFLDAVADKYVNRFRRVETKILLVRDNFPRLTRNNVAGEIKKAHYEIDLDLLPDHGEIIGQILKQLGMI